MDLQIILLKAWVIYLIVIASLIIIGMAGALFFNFTMGRNKYGWIPIVIVLLVLIFGLCIPIAVAMRK